MQNFIIRSITKTFTSHEKSNIDTRNLMLWNLTNLKLMKLEKTEIFKRHDLETEDLWQKELSNIYSNDN